MDMISCDICGTSGVKVSALECKVALFLEYACPEEESSTFSLSCILTFHF